MELMKEPMIVVGGRSCCRVKGGSPCLSYPVPGLGKAKTCNVSYPIRNRHFPDRPTIGINFSKSGMASLHRNANGISHLKTIQYLIRVNAVKLVVLTMFVGNVHPFQNRLELFPSRRNPR